MAARWRCRASTAIGPALLLALLGCSPLLASASAAAGPRVEEISSMNFEHAGATATALPGGDVLVAGGYHYDAPQDWHGGVTKKAEVFHPATGEFTPLAAETAARHQSAAAAPLGDGRVLIAGGGASSELVSISDAAEIYDPSTEEFAATDSLSVPRSAPYAAPLPDGTVLVGGGSHLVEGRTPLEPEASTEIYDPASEEFVPGPEMDLPRSGAVASPLPDGRVLVLGGSDGEEWTCSTEIYDPGSGSFEPGPPIPGTAAAMKTATTLASGRILVITSVAALEYDPATESFIDTGLDPTTGWGVAAAALPRGGALLTGKGSGGYGPEAKRAWIYSDPPLPVGDGIDFDEVKLGETAAPRTLTITNEGAQDLGVDSISLGGPQAGDFEIVGDGCTAATLAFGEDCELQITVTPSSWGALSASVEVFDNTSSSPHPFPLAAVAPNEGKREGGTPPTTGSAAAGTAGSPGAAAQAATGPKRKRETRPCRRGKPAAKRQAGKKGSVRHCPRRGKRHEAGHRTCLRPGQSKAKSGRGGRHCVVRKHRGHRTHRFAS